MMKRNFLSWGSLLLLAIFSLVSCEKKDSSSVNTEKSYKLTVSRNDKVFKVFRFNDTRLLSQYNFDTTGVIAERIYYTYTDQKIWKDYLDKDSVLKYYHVYKLGADNDVDTVSAYFQVNNTFSDMNHAYVLEYYDQGGLKKIVDQDKISGERRDVDFGWLGNNLVKKEFPVGTGFQQYSYEYDNHPSFFKLIKAPVDIDFGQLKIADIPISENNIKKITVQELENNDIANDTIKYEL